MVDYLVDEDNDLLIKNGDFVKGESTAKHQDDLMMMNKGELRQYPKTGVGIESYFNDDNLGDLYQEIQKQFEADGMTVSKLQITSDGKIEVKAVYK